ncbi:MAG: preprotein translocase subunit SecG [Clostridia bacterium]|nr:preprotein translocase subunit SecG [Clostridia bacterium]
MTIFLNILLIISSIVLIVSVLMQSSDTDGMGALTGGSDTFFGKNKNSTLEGKLALITKISASVFVVLAIISLFVK